MKMNCPHKDCAKRCVGCYLSCGIYMGGKGESDARYDKQGDIDYIDFKVKTIAATKRRKR